MENFTIVAWFLLTYPHQLYTHTHTHNIFICVYDMFSKAYEDGEEQFYWYTIMWALDKKRS